MTRITTVTFELEATRRETLVVVEQTSLPLLKTASKIQPAAVSSLAKIDKPQSGANPVKKRITVDYQYAAINFNAKLETLVNSLVEADIQDKLPRTLETQYDRRYVESAECEQRANRALEILGERYPTNQFAAHSDATAFPPNSYWRILATTTTGRPLSKQKMVKVRAAAKRIVKNISAKYPELAKQHRKAIEKKESRTKFWGAIKNLLAP